MNKKKYTLLIIILIVIVYILPIYKNNGNVVISIFNETEIDSLNVIIRVGSTQDSFYLKNHLWDNHIEKSLFIPYGINNIQIQFPELDQEISKSMFIWRLHLIYIDLYGTTDNINGEWDDRFRFRGFE